MSCCFFLTDRTLPTKVVCFGGGEGEGEGEGRFLNFFFKILVEMRFFEELGLNFGDWRKSGWMMEHNVRNIKRWFWI